MASWAVLLQFRHSISSRKRECTSWCFFSKLVCCCSEWFTNCISHSTILVSQGISSGYETDLTLLKRSREWLTLSWSVVRASRGTTDLPRVISSIQLSILRDWISISKDPFLLITKIYISSASLINIHFLSVIDKYYRFPFVFTCLDMNTSIVIKSLFFFTLFGMPAFVHSDEDLLLKSWTEFLPHRKESSCEPHYPL